MNKLTLRDEKGRGVAAARTGYGKRARCTRITGRATVGTEALAGALDAAPQDVDLLSEDEHVPTKRGGRWSRTATRTTLVHVAAA
jgi:hypothetical protein